MRVLVTGATAPLGEAIVARLLATPDVGLVLAVGRDGPAVSRVSPSRAGRARPLGGQSVRLMQSTLSDA